MWGRVGWDGWGHGGVGGSGKESLGPAGPAGEEGDGGGEEVSPSRTRGPEGACDPSRAEARKPRRGEKKNNR